MRSSFHVCRKGSRRLVGVIHFARLRCFMTAVPRFGAQKQRPGVKVNRIEMCTTGLDRERRTTTWKMIGTFNVSGRVGAKKLARPSGGEPITVAAATIAQNLPRAPQARLCSLPRFACHAHPSRISRDVDRGGEKGFRCCTFYLSSHHALTYRFHSLPDLSD